jgi:hypothetical protein
VNQDRVARILLQVRIHLFQQFEETLEFPLRDHRPIDPTVDEDVFHLIDDPFGSLGINTKHAFPVQIIFNHDRSAFDNKRLGLDILIKGLGEVLKALDVQFIFLTNA